MVNGNGQKGQKKWGITKTRKMFLHSTLNLKLQKIFDQDILSGVDPTKLFFFANEEFFRFSLVSLRFCYIQKKLLIAK